MDSKSFDIKLFWLKMSDYRHFKVVNPRIAPGSDVCTVISRRDLHSLANQLTLADWTPGDSPLASCESFCGCRELPPKCGQFLTFCHPCCWCLVSSQYFTSYLHRMYHRRASQNQHLQLRNLLEAGPGTIRSHWSQIQSNCHGWSRWVIRPIRPIRLDPNMDSSKG